MRIETIAHFIHRFYLLLNIETTITGMVAFWLGSLTGPLFGVTQAFIGGLWCAISAIIILELQEKMSITNAWLRFIGTLIASLVTGGLVSGLGYSIPALALSIFASILICTLIRAPAALKTTVITVLVVFAVGRLQPHLNVWWNCLGRFTESTEGILVGLVIIILFMPARYWLRKISLDQPKSLS